MTRYAIMVGGELKEVVEGRVQLGMRLATWGGAHVEVWPVEYGCVVFRMDGGLPVATLGASEVSTAQAWKAVAANALGHDGGPGAWVGDPTLTVETLYSLRRKLGFDPDLAPEAAAKLRDALAALEGGS